MTAARSAPLVRVTWTDPVTGKNGYLVVHTLVSGIATGGTRMRAGCTESEVANLAYGMALKTATFNLPVGGDKGGIDCDPKDPQLWLRALNFTKRPFGICLKVAFFWHLLRRCAASVRPLPSAPLTPICKPERISPI